MAKHANHEEYWDDVGPRLAAYVNQRRNPRLESALIGAIAYYAFMVEEFSSKAKSNKELLGHLTAILVVAQDVLRGVLPAFVELTPVTLASLARVALEMHVNLRFIVTSSESTKWAQRYGRFAEVEKLLRQVHASPDEGQLFPLQELEAIRARCPEWITKKGKVRTSWTAEDDLSSLSQLARAAGLERDYVSVYGVTSKFVHASAIVTNLYAGPNGIGAVGQVERCEGFAFLASNYCLNTLKDACSFFCVPLDQFEFATVRIRIVDASKSATPSAPDGST